MLGNNISFILAFSAGVLGVMQGMINAHIGKDQGQLGMIIGVSAVQITVALLLLWRVRSAAPLDLQVIPWMVIAGAMGVAIMFGTSYATGKVGTLSVFVLIIVGQMLASSIIDHFGVLGLPKNPVTLPKICSMLLILIGVWCLIKSSR
ncbi:hypothetical protein A8709_21155 [Paenibacillus pectinilyticus]|uniref:DMT family transporter n=1 Tax=Paenibacillus pectinilyticus TaxID=512399 RepID=A0A1C0ZXK6_9BACL|nr:DMT family transporter [Paenibacillus pectinilyticus]OCT12843.1 hypothetical protein A8709_21155 [Paenibacillus pectinilyticus]